MTNLATIYLLINVQYILTYTENCQMAPQKVLLLYGIDIKTWTNTDCLNLTRFYNDSRKNNESQNQLNSLTFTESI
jgi:hypothetical protein